MVTIGHINDPDHYIAGVAEVRKGRVKHVYICTLCEATAVSYSAVDAYAQMDEHWMTMHREAL